MLVDSALHDDGRGDDDGSDRGPLAATLVKGANGDDVVRLQERLAALGFQPGPVDGQFGNGTQQAVWAFKKLVGNVNWKDFAASGDQTSVSEALWQQMNDPAFAIVPRRPNTGKHVEIYLPLQVLALFDANNQPIFVTHISTGELNPDGTDATFCEDSHVHDRHPRQRARGAGDEGDLCRVEDAAAVCSALKRYEDGQHVSPLGGMKNPWYFNYGIAIHGAQNVPDHPASHGCVRMSNGLADVFPTLGREGQRGLRVGLRRPRARGLHGEGVDPVVQPARSGRHDDHHVDHHDPDDDARADHHGRTGHVGTDDRRSDDRRADHRGTDDGLPPRPSPRRSPPPRRSDPPVPPAVAMSERSTPRSVRSPLDRPRHGDGLAHRGRAMSERSTGCGPFAHRWVGTRRGGAPCGAPPHRCSGFQLST